MIISKLREYAKINLVCIVFLHTLAYNNLKSKVMTHTFKTEITGTSDVDLWHFWDSKEFDLDSAKVVVRWSLDLIAKESHAEIELSIQEVELDYVLLKADNYELSESHSLVLKDCENGWKIIMNTEQINLGSCIEPTAIDIDKKNKKVEIYINEYS